MWQGVEVLTDIAAVERIDALCCCSRMRYALDACRGVVNIVKGDNTRRAVVGDVAEGLVGRQLFGFIRVVPAPVGLYISVAELHNIHICSIASSREEITIKTAGICIFVCVKVRGQAGSICRHHRHAGIAFYVVISVEDVDRAIVWLVDVIDEQAVAVLVTVPSFLLNAFQHKVFVVVVGVGNLIGRTAFFCGVGDGYLLVAVQFCNDNRPSHLLLFPCCVCGRIETITTVFPSVHEIPVFHLLVVDSRRG